VEIYIGSTLSQVWIEILEKVGYFKAIKKVKELIEETRFAKPIDFRYILAGSKITGNASLVIYHGDSDILALQNRGQHDPWLMSNTQIAVNQFDLAIEKNILERC